MCSSKKFVYAIFALITFKILFLYFSLGLNENTSLSVFGQNPENVLSAEPIEVLFRILFFLFILSPPIIVILLFMIWCELRKRNKMK